LAVKYFYKGQKLHLKDDPSVQMTVFKVEENAVVVHRWIDDYKYVNERYTDLYGTMDVVSEGWG
jgi:hypothetical protein